MAYNYREMKKLDRGQRNAFLFIVSMGVVSLLSDMTHEGARSLTGPYLGLLGASAFTVGLVSGLGELIGYALRCLSGIIADRTRSYWLLTFVGYGMNLFAVPLLALAGHWEAAAALIILERTGKAIRKPSKDAMMSFAARQVGTGFGFAIEEFLDQLGAMLGPLFLAFIISGQAARGTLFGYRKGFAFLLIPAILTMAALVLSRLRFPSPREFETCPAHAPSAKPGRAFYVYMAAASLLAAGFADFPLIGFHFLKRGIIGGAGIPLMYTVAMGTDALAALVFGRLFDRIGMKALMLSTLLSALFAPFAFLARSMPLVIAGVVLWGIGMGAQESIVKAVIADLAPPDKRATAYGIFNTVFGLSWFLGSALMGFLYDRSLVTLVAFSVAAQLAAAVFFHRVRFRTAPQDMSI